MVRFRPRLWSLSQASGPKVILHMCSVQHPHPPKPMPFPEKPAFEMTLLTSAKVLPPQGQSSMWEKQDGLSILLLAQSPLCGGHSETWLLVSPRNTPEGRTELAPQPGRVTMTLGQPAWAMVQQVPCWSDFTSRASQAGLHCILFEKPKKENKLYESTLQPLRA